jgi:hypothetical protein
MLWTEQKIIGLRKFLCLTKTKDGKAYVAKEWIGAAFWSKSKFNIHISKINSSILTALFGSIYICEQTYSQMKIINSRRRWRLADKLVPK